MQSGFTKKAEEALKNSATTAYAYGHSSIGSEHILIGLMQTDESVAQTVLLKNEVDLERFEEMVSQLMHPDNMAEYSNRRVTLRELRVFSIWQPGKPEGLKRS